MLRTPVGRLRVIALIEDDSYLLLLGIAMPLKYFAGLPGVVLAVGWAHGVLFVLYVVALAEVSFMRRWRLARILGAGCRPVVVVTGANAELSRRELEGLDVREVSNARWETGMASSVRAGIEGLVSADANVAAAVLLLCDQPHVTEDVISSLLTAHHATGSSVIASAYGGNFGAPALFSRTLFTELMRLEGMSGAKEIIKRNALEAHFLPFPNGEVDVDTPDDFSRLTAQGIEREQS